MYSDNQVDQDLIKQEVEKQLKNLGVLGDEDQRQPEPIKMRLGDKDYSFANMEEAQNAINQAFTSVAQNQATLLQQIEDAQAAQRTSGDDKSPQFDKDKFLQLIANDPVEAFNYVDTIRYGEARVPDYVKQNLERIPQLEQTITAYRFTQAHPEFANTDANANVLRAIGQKLNIPIHTYEGLEAAYSVAQSYNVLTPAQKTESQQQNIEPSSRFGAQQQQVNTPPAISRGGNALPDADVENYLETLSNEQLRALLAR
ncbi:hypothetical protein UFOVP434_54 [uncultured Caudovirales phage]|uniref:Uncharacterized protein n=1 Tax=uncultured Caudovirales phage TaxID=2100421 RepID=A0A6J5MD39_9CAUD|nr:hypothetical protein UFOVP434_54 [uncultured Caudovirales phage]